MFRGFARAGVLLAFALSDPARGQGAAATGAERPAADADASTDTSADAACIVARNNALTGIAELAEGDESYLVLDLATSSITVALHAVPVVPVPSRSIWHRATIVGDAPPLCWMAQTVPVAQLPLAPGS